jgi:hypothetical protein
MRAGRYGWWRAIRASDLSPTARHVALNLSTYMNQEGGGAWPSMATLADDTGRSRAVVKRAIRELRDAGFLTVESGGGRRGDGGYVSNRYRASFPSGVVDEPPNASNGVVDEPDGAGLGGSSGEVGGSSGEGGGSWTAGNGVAHDPRGTQELAIQEPKQHAASKTRTPDGVEMDDQVATTSSQEREGQDQEPTAPRTDYYDRGRQYADWVREGKLTEEDAVKIAATIRDPEERHRFAAGMRDRFDNLKRIGVAS